jgi:hypothetical protein
MAVINTLTLARLRNHLPNLAIDGGIGCLSEAEAWSSDALLKLNEASLK